MACRLCQALRKPMPQALRTWAEGVEASRERARQAKRERARAAAPASPPPQDVQ